MGHEGMKASLISREVIADSIELGAVGYQFDALVTIGGCDKTQPACAMAMARTNLPSVYLYGGSIPPGEWNGKEVTIQDVFEGDGAGLEGDDDRRSSSRTSSATRARPTGRAEGCSLRTRWPRPSRRSASRSPTARPPSPRASCGCRRSPTRADGR